MSNEDNMEVELIRRDIENLTREVADLREAVSGLVEAWRTANGVVRFVKWSAGIATALAALCVTARVGWKLFVESAKEALR